MYRFAIALALLAVMSSSPAFSQKNDNEFCYYLENTQKKSNIDIGKRIDEITIDRGMYVLCGIKSVTFRKEITMSQTQFRDGWKERKKAQWSQAMCEEDAWAEKIREGWTVKLFLYFSDGYRWESNAVCPSKPTG